MKSRSTEVSVYSVLEVNFCGMKMIKSNFDTSSAINKATNRMVQVFRWVGLWPTQNSSIFYWIYGVLVLSTGSFLITFTMMFQLICFTKKEDLTGNSYMALTELVLCVKIINFYFRYRSVKTHLNTIHEFEFQTDAERKLFIKRLRFAYFVYMMDFVLMNIVHVLIYIDIFTAPERKIAFPAWHPIDWKIDTRNYILVLIFQIYGMGITTNIQVVIQQYPSLMFCCVSAQFEILSMRLQNIGHKQFLEDENSEDFHRHPNYLSPKVRKQISISLKNNIKTHLDTLKYFISICNLKNI